MASESMATAEVVTTPQTTSGVRVAVDVAIDEVEECRYLFYRWLESRRRNADRAQLTRKNGVQLANVSATRVRNGAIRRPVAVVLP